MGDVKLHIKLHNKKGFTLIEMIVIIVILAIISIIAIPTVLGLNAEAEKQVCETNRDTILRMYQIYCAQETDCSLVDFFDLDVDKIITSAICPSHGDFTPTGQGITANITCSIHDGGGEPSPDPDPDPVFPLIPGTDVYVNSTWPADEEFVGSNGYNQVVWVHGGQTYFYQGQYYVVSGNVDLFSNTGNPYPTPINGWWYNNNSVGVIKISDKRWNFTGSTTEEFQAMTGTSSGSVNKGDVCTWQGKTYVFTNATYGWVAPPHNNSDWVEIKTQL